MTGDEIAIQVLAALGGRENVLTNTVCMTRLRVTLRNPEKVDYKGLNDVHNVLGTASRGRNGLEVVFGPRIIDSVYHAFVKLTGRAAGSDALFPMNRPRSNMRVQINSTRPLDADIDTQEPDDAHEADPSKDAPLIDDAEMSVLEDIFGDSEEPEQQDQDESEEKVETADEDATVTAESVREEDEVKEQEGPRLLVINGPNLNMVGIREPDLYGKQDYPAMLQLCKDAAQEFGFSRCDCYQSNHEGDLVDKIQDAYGAYDGIVINPGAYTHTSIALLDALKAVSIPAVEVHISKVNEREPFRQISYVRLACFLTVSGLGIEGYRKAIQELAEYIAN